MDEPLKCEHNEQMTALMSLALDGLLDADDEQRLQRHLSVCRACQSEWEVMQQVSALLEQSAVVGPPLGFASRLERRLDEKTRRRRRAFGGLAVLTGSLSLAWVTAATVMVIILGLLAWHSPGSLPAVQQGTSAVSQIASGVGLMGKGASLFLSDLLLRYGLLLILLLGTGLALLAGVWIWLFVKRPDGSRHNGYA